MSNFSINFLLSSISRQCWVFAKLSISFNFYFNLNQGCISLIFTLIQPTTPNRRINSRALLYYWKDNYMIDERLLTDRLLQAYFRLCKHNVKTSSRVSYDFSKSSSRALWDYLKNPLHLLQDILKTYLWLFQDYLKTPPRLLQDSFLKLHSD